MKPKKFFMIQEKIFFEDHYKPTRVSNALSSNYIKHKSIKAKYYLLNTILI